MAADVSWSRFRDAVAILHGEGRLHIEENGLARHVLPAVPGIASCARQVVVLRRDTTWCLHDWLMRHGPVSMQALAEHTHRDWLWTEKATRARVRELERVGLLRRLDAPVGEDQRCRWLEAVEPETPVRGLLR